MLGDPNAAKATGWSRSGKRRGRGAGRAWVRRAGNFPGPPFVQLSGGDRPRHTLSLAAGLALAEAIDVARPGPSADAQMAQRCCCSAEARRNLLERSGERVAVGFGVNLASAPRAARPQGARARWKGHARSVARRCWRRASRGCWVCGERAKARHLFAPGRSARTPRHAADRAPRQGRGDRRPLRRARA